MVLVRVSELVAIRKTLSGMNLTPSNRLWFVIAAKAGIQQ
jgi:hypothetical protein